MTLSNPHHRLLGAADGPVVVALDGLGDDAHLPALRAGIRLVVPSRPGEADAVLDALGVDAVGLLARDLVAMPLLGGRVRAVSLLSPIPDVLVAAHVESAAVLDTALRFCAPA